MRTKVEEGTTEQGGWDPKSAFVMSIRVAKERRNSRELAEGLENFPDPHVRERTVTIPGRRDGPHVLTIPGFVEWLAQQADLAQAEVERHGDQRAVKAFVEDFQASTGTDIEFYENGMPVDPDLRPDMAPLSVAAAA